MRLTYEGGRGGAALVTGGSGGIGSSVVAALAEAGVPVGMTWASRRDEAQRVAASCTGAAVKAFEWSRPDAQSARDLVEAVTRECGPVRYLVSCTGIAQGSAFHRIDEPEWRRLIDTNLAMVFALTRAAIFPMMKGAFGRVVLTGSVSGLRGLKGHTIYAATKAALHGFGRSLAMECAPFGVTVNSIAPGWIDTPMLTSPLREEVTAGIPVGRLGTPRDVAGCVAFLLSDQAGYITGQTLAVDGGVTA